MKPLQRRSSDVLAVVVAAATGAPAPPLLCVGDNAVEIRCGPCCLCRLLSPARCSGSGSAAGLLAASRHASRAGVNEKQEGSEDGGPDGSATHEEREECDVDWEAIASAAAS